MAEETEKTFTDINQITAQWAQGDCALGAYEFFFKANPSHHVATSNSLKEDEDIIAQEIDGFCVVTQTCDIVRDCKDRPYLEVVPVVSLDETAYEEAAKGGRPNYGYIPALRDRKM